MHSSLQQCPPQSGAALPARDGHIRYLSGAELQPLGAGKLVELVVLDRPICSHLFEVFQMVSYPLLVLSAGATDSFKAAVFAGQIAVRPFVIRVGYTAERHWASGD